jgi:hypothetical protein
MRSRPSPLDFSLPLDGSVHASATAGATVRFTSDSRATAAGRQACFTACGLRHVKLTIKARKAGTFKAIVSRP